ARLAIDTPEFEAGERVLQAPALLPANQPVGRDFVIREDQLGRVEPLIAELFELFADREPRPLLGQEEAHAAVARIGGEVRFDQEREDLAVDAVRDPGLGAIDDVALISLPARNRADRLQIGAAVRLGQRQAAAQFAGRKARQKVFLLLRRAEALDRR